MQAFKDLEENSGMPDDFRSIITRVSKVTPSVIGKLSPDKYKGKFGADGSRNIERSKSSSLIILKKDLKAKRDLGEDNGTSIMATERPNVIRK